MSELHKVMMSSQLCLSQSAGLDCLFDWIDGRMADGYGKQVDKELADLQVEKLSTEMLIGVLTCTFEYRKELPSRPELFNKIHTFLVTNLNKPERILKGLQ